MNEFLTWETLGTMAGATGAVTLVTQFLNWLTGDKVTGWGMRAISFAVSLAVLYGATFFAGAGLNAATATITFLNAIIVTLAANGLYDGMRSAIPKK